MMFTEKLLAKFGATLGAASEVTLREATGDKSVTIDRNEKAVLYSVYTELNFTRAGGAVSDGKPTHHTFKVFNSNNRKYEEHQISIKYPKATGKELRLYFNRESNFYPTSGSVWYIFTKEGEDIPYIGFMNAMEWENIASGEEQKVAFETAYSLDEDDDAYQKELHSPQAQEGKIKQSTTKFPRSPALAAKAIVKCGHKCEYDNTHESFLSAASGKQYVEVHHLIPISLSGQFEYSLDVPANLVVLCPNCHRSVHFGTSDVKKQLLNKFYNDRVDNLAKAGIDINFGQLCGHYGI